MYLPRNTNFKIIYQYIIMKLVFLGRYIIMKHKFGEILPPRSYAPTPPTIGDLDFHHVSQEVLMLQLTFLA